MLTILLPLLIGALVQKKLKLNKVGSQGRFFFTAQKEAKATKTSRSH